MYGDAWYKKDRGEGRPSGPILRLKEFEVHHSFQDCTPISWMMHRYVLDRWQAWFLTLALSYNGDYLRL
jgi:hypothetical protein